MNPGYRGKLKLRVGNSLNRSEAALRRGLVPGELRHAVGLGVGMERAEGVKRRLSALPMGMTLMA